MASENVIFETQWCVWADCHIAVTPGQVQSKEEFESSLHLIGSIENAHDLWSWLQHMPQPSALPVNANIYIMRQGIMPMWEHEANANGGHITLRCDKYNTDHLWRVLVLMAVGEELESFLPTAIDDGICGVAVSARNTSNVLQIWNRQSEKFNAVAVCKRIQQAILAAPASNADLRENTLQKVLANPIYKSHRGSCRGVALAPEAHARLPHEHPLNP